MKIDDEGRVLYFNEKPRGAELKSMVQYHKRNLSTLVVLLRLCSSVMDLNFSLTLLT
jgi:hypothetical protein